MNENKSASPTSFLVSSANPASEFLSEKGLERRLKRHFFKKEHRFMARCALGFEGSLESEIVKHLPQATQIKSGHARVEWAGPLEHIYLSHLYLQTSTQIFIEVAEFKAWSFAELNNKAEKIDWELFLGFAPEFKIKVKSEFSTLNMLRRIQEVFEKSIVKHQKNLGVSTQPNASENTPLIIDIRLFHDQVYVRLNLSGPSLHKRGYKLNPGFAPLNECMAASVVQRALKKYEFSPENSIIWDPCVGGGTLIAEAFLYLSGASLIHSAPKFGAKLAFEHTPFFKSSIWNRLSQKQISEAKTLQHIQFLASDLSPNAIESCKCNLEPFAIENLKIFKSDFLQENNPRAQSKGIIISNLPYGKRASGQIDILEIYPKFKEQLVKMQGWHFAFLIPNHPEPLEALLGHSQIQIHKKIKTSNGGLDVLFVLGEVLESNLT